MAVLLTGATGFTGGKLLDLLLESGHDITCFVRPTSDIGKVKNRHVPYVSGDLDDFDSILHALRGKEALINVAPMTGRADIIVEACREAGVRRAIFFSSTSIFTRLEPASKKRKLSAERAVVESGLDYTIIRPTMIYGSHEDRNMCRLVRYLMKHRVIPVVGTGRYLQQPVYYEDLARAVALALDSPVGIGKAYNVAGADALTYNEVIDTTARLLGRTVLKVHVPLSLARLALRAYERTSPRPRLREEQVLRLNEDKAFSIDEAQADLGYAPRTFEEGMRLEIEEIKAHDARRHARRPRGHRT